MRKIDGSSLRRTTLAAVAALFAVVVIALTGDPAAAYQVRQAQWYLDPLQITQAQQLTRGRGVTVAVIDTGVDARIPELSGRVVAGSGFGPGQGSDGTHDVEGHGTAMAALIAGSGGDDERVLGVAPEATILPVQVLGAKGGGPDSAIAEALRYAADHGAKVANLSLGGQGRISSELLSAIRYAQSKDVVVVAAAGNVANGDRDVSGIAAVPGVVAVSGIGQNGDAWDGSAKGPETVVSSAAMNIIVPTRSGEGLGYRLSDGTSQATAITSGVIALIRAQHPDLDAANVIERLISTVQDKGPTGRDDAYGFGEVQAYAALTGNVQKVTANPLQSESDGTPNETTPTGPANPSVQPIPMQPAQPQPGQPQAGQPQAGGAQSDNSLLIVVVAVSGALMGLIVIAAAAVLIVVLRRRSQPVSTYYPYAGYRPPGY
ncbi:S8 family serine peptidase [Fodinicola acaciae]|uniref:S8 family serine peptidase n=1 Tax=Fodinicola acaciae TaxID=2681555 RepID=UPI0013D3AC57|nr:S8 family serine peptidase [Fodinicola acaciae]